MEEFQTKNEILTSKTVLLYFHDKKKRRRDKSRFDYTQFVYIPFLINKIRDLFIYLLKIILVLNLIYRKIWKNFEQKKTKFR